MIPEPSIRLTDLTTGYTSGRHRIEVTKNLNACLQPGSIVSLLGPNGAGKSTLMRTLAGFDKPLAGSITLLGKPLESYSPRALARSLSVVLTERTSPENMTVEALVSLGRAPYTDFWGRLTTEDRNAVSEALSLTGIESLKHRTLPTLSDGERQKVMIAKAIAQQTPVILLDEPTAFLDYPSKVEIMLMLTSLAHRLDKTVFLSTHDLELALQLSDALWLIDRKLGVTVGTHRGLADSGQLERYFCRPGITFDKTSALFRIDKAEAKR